MELRTRNIFFDTQYFVSKSLDFGNNDLQNLVQLVKKKLARVFITDITYYEIRKKVNEEVSQSYKRLHHSDVRYLKSLPLYRQFLKTYPEKKGIEFVLNSFEDFLVKAKVSIASSNAVAPMDVFFKYFEGKPLSMLIQTKTEEMNFPTDLF